ncbi:MAG: hypothetical protein M5U09_18025 [Gammaproteobacteria bacterium]|nr:hypothetical protein [Gammaproteobacteria bacterium]
MTIPPSPLVRFLELWKLNPPQVPIEPTCRPRWIAPWAWAQSSIGARPCFSASLPNASRSARMAAEVDRHEGHRPGPMAASTAAGSRLKLSGSASAKQTRHCNAIGAEALAMKVYSGQMISPAKPSPSASNAPDTAALQRVGAVAG